ncbi:MAG: META domain-containing protein [Muribaculaceae bacterium]|nr:META domain-containing protein [Muribaculaceae bacterium]MDE7387088.1 META domain-containing protein [Muribaculaceae bacterium]
MKKAFILAAVTVVCLSGIVSCKSDNPLVGKWEVVTYADPFKATMGHTSVSPDEVYTLQFHDTGLFSFTTDCNTISGEYTLSGKRLRFLNILATEMACDREIVERSVKCQLPVIDSYEQPDDSTLCLRACQGNTIIRLVKKQS